MAVEPVAVKWTRVETSDEEDVLIVDATDKHSDTEDEEPQQTSAADEAVKTRTPCFVYVVVAFSVIGGFLFGYDTSVIAGALIDLEKEFKLVAFQKELIVSITIASAALGAMLGAPSNEKLGRRPTILMASFVFTVGAVLMAAAPTTSTGWFMILTGRAVVGVGIGLASMTVPIYLAECAPAHMRGRLTVADNAAITCGQFVAGVVDFGFSFLRKGGWRFMFGIAAIPAFVRFVAFFFLPESPRWLVGRREEERARRVLEQLRPRGYRVDRELKQIVDNIQEAQEENQQNIFMKLKSILTKRHLLMALVLGCGIQAIQQLSGINTVMYYAPTTLKMAGVVDDQVAIGLGAVVAFGNFIFTMVGFYCIDRAGRRILVLSSLAGVIVSLFLLGLAFFLVNHDAQPACASSNSTCLHSNCDDCVIDDFCHYCSFNGSYRDTASIGVCVHSDSPFYNDSQRTCVFHDPTPQSDKQFCNASEMLPLENVTVETYEYCPSRYSMLTLAALLVYIVSFAPGMGPGPWTVTAEIFPNWARSVGNSASTVTNWLSNLLVSITFLHVTRYLTRFGAFWTYTGIALGGWLFLFLMLPETKGKTLEEVENLFKGPVCPPLGIAKKKYKKLGNSTDPH